jgi:hypothetical protein
MGRKRHSKHAEKREAGGFVPMPHSVLRSNEFASLSPRATKLLLDLLAQYKGDNNGDLSPAMTLMRERGWRSGAGLAAAVRELDSTRFVVCTRRGGRHKASLYGCTFFAVDWCAGKLDIQAPTRQFMGTWRMVNGTFAAPLVGQLKRDYSTGGAIEPRPTLDCSTGGSVRAPFDPPIAPQVDTFLEVYHCRDGERPDLDRWADDGGPSIHDHETAGGAGRDDLPFRS